MNAGPVHESPAMAAALGRPLHTPLLLVVDDQPINVRALYQIFAADHRVLMATRGEQALAICAARQPDLVLLDVAMQGMDGHEVCRRLKADPATRDIPVIFVSAYDDEDAEAAGLDLGAVDFISKPVNPKIVRARVRTHLTLKAQSDLLRQWVYIDGLTGVYNRRHFDERLASEWGRAERNANPLSVLLIDVDFFKRYNDRYGHQAGDDCLRRIASCLQAGLRRPADLLARYGGEEFACLLPETGLEDAIARARELEQQVRHAAIAHDRSDVASVVTISVGAASRGVTQAMQASAMLSEADAQLYRAKAGGRARVCGASAAPLPAPVEPAGTSTGVPA